MSKVQYVLFYLSLLNFVCHYPCLIELPQVEDNSIIETEAAIRSTVNQIFSLVKLTKIRERPKLKQYGLIHNYFTSVTLRDYNNLKEIAQLTRVDYKNADNKTWNFIELINEILNADSLTENEENNANSVEYITRDAAHYLHNYLKQFNYFQEIVSNGPRVDVNEEVAKILAKINIKDLNITETGHDNSLDDDTQILENNEFWQPAEGTRRVYKGKHTRIKTFPFMAVIQAFNMFQCAGSIISSDLVLTAASCLQLAYNNRFYRENPNYLSVRVGSNFYDGGGEVVAILEVYFHPSYSPKTLRHNLAVVRLIRHLKLKKKRVKKIAIDTIPAQLPFNTEGITIVGWGATSISNRIKNGFENKLSYAVLDVYDLKECQDVYSKEYVTQNHFCAGFISKGSGACNRDVGGPGVAGGILRGVVSFGSPQCGTPDAPTVFTKVGYYADWIEGIMEQEVPHGAKHTTLLKKPWTWSMDVERTTFTTRMHLTPVTATEIFELLSFETTTERPIERLNKKVDMKLFREFLKTMLNSKEIDEYLDQFMSEQHVGRQFINPTTEAFAAEFATKNIEFEPEISDYEAEWTTKTANVTLKQESTTHVYEGNETKKEIGDQKELERGIIKLINNADLREILIESVSTATMPNVKQTTTIQNKNITKMVKKEKKTSKKKSELKELKKLQNNMKKEPEKKNEIKKENEKVTTFLYLTERKKDQNNLKIYNKADDGIDDDFESNLSEIDQEGQDIVFHVSNEETNDDSGNYINKKVSNSDEMANIDLNYDVKGEINYGTEPLVRRGEDKQDKWMDVYDGKYAVTNESSQENEEKEGLNIDIPSIPEILAIPSLLDQFIPPSQTQIDFRLRDIGVENKSDSQSEPKKNMVDVLNEVIKAETNANATNALTNDSVGGWGSFQALRSQDLRLVTASNNQTTLSLL